MTRVRFNVVLSAAQYGGNMLVAIYTAVPLLVAVITHKLTLAASIETMETAEMNETIF